MFRGLQVVGATPLGVAGVALAALLAGCGSGYGLQDFGKELALSDTGGGGPGGSGGGVTDTGLNGSGSGGSGSGGSGSGGSGSGGSGSGGSGSGGSGSGGSGGSGSSGSGGSSSSTDADGDGYPSSSDCDDTNPRVNPGAAEVCGDGVDNDCDGGIDNDPSCSRNIVGAFVVLFGYGQFFPGSYNCGLLWDYTGTEDTTACPSCDFAFDLTAVYNSSASFTDGSCTGMTNFSVTWAHDSDYYGGTPYFLEYYAGSWTPITSNASFNPSTGYWEWSAGLLDYPYSYFYFTYYYTYYQYSIAYVY